MDDDTTTIRLSFKTKERLGNFGTTNETFDDLLNKLITEVEECRKKK